MLAIFVKLNNKYKLIINNMENVFLIKNNELNYFLKHKQNILKSIKNKNLVVSGSAIYLNKNNIEVIKNYYTIKKKLN